MLDRHENSTSAIHTHQSYNLGRVLVARYEEVPRDEANPEKKRMGGGGSDLHPLTSGTTVVGFEPSVEVSQNSSCLSSPTEPKSFGFCWCHATSPTTEVCPSARAAEGGEGGEMLGASRVAAVRWSCIVSPCLFLLLEHPERVREFPSRGSARDRKASECTVEGCQKAGLERIV